MDPVDFAAGQSPEFRFEAKALRLQSAGMLILCSFGDRIPIRLSAGFEMDYLASNANSESLIDLASLRTMVK